METKDAFKIMGPYATTARWSAGEDPKLAVAFGMPLTEIWMCELKPGASTAESFGFVQTVKEYCRWAIDICSHILTMDPNLVDIHYMRVDYALWIGHERTQEFLEEFEVAMKPEYYSANSCAAFCALVLRSAPEIQERLMPMVMLMASKAVDKEQDNPEYQKILDKVLQLQR